MAIRLRARRAPSRLFSVIPHYGFEFIFNSHDAGVALVSLPATQLIRVYLCSDMTNLDFGSRMYTLEKTRAAQERGAPTDDAESSITVRWDPTSVARQRM